MCLKHILKSLKIRQGLNSVNYVQEFNKSKVDLLTGIKPVKNLINVKLIY